jgi:hypothetical protein
VLNLYGLDDLFDAEGVEYFACTKKCYAAVKKTLSESERAVWSKDGKRGPDDPVNSESILLEWLQTQGNYAHFRGNKNGQKKTQICDAIAKKINDSGVVRRRSGKSVWNKVQAIERSFRVAHDFTQTETGAGLKENYEGTFNDLVKKKCPHYFDLCDIFVDRSSITPLALSYTFDDNYNFDKNSQLDSNNPCDSDSDSRSVESEAHLTGFQSNRVELTSCQPTRLGV